MAAVSRDRNTQFNEKGVTHDYGTVTLGSDGAATFKTAMKTVRAGLATFRSGAIASEALVVSNVSGGAVTITSVAANAGAVVSYDLIGLF